MTALVRTYPEPAGDIAAQMAALVDPGHPKRALWVSLGTPMVSVVFDDLARVTTPVGWLFAAPRLVALVQGGAELGDACERSWITLSAGRRGFPGFFQLPVVQAVDADGWVVQEQLVSWGRVGEARRRASAYGPGAGGVGGGGVWRVGVG